MYFVDIRMVTISAETRMGLFILIGRLLTSATPSPLLDQTHLIEVSTADGVM